MVVADAPACQRPSYLLRDVQGCAIKLPEVLRCKSGDFRILGDLMMNFGGFCRIWGDLGGFGRVWTLEGPWDALRGPLGRPGGPLKGPWRAPEGPLKGEAFLALEN